MTAIINAGYLVFASPINGDLNNWSVIAKSSNSPTQFNVDVQAAASLATSQGVTGKISTIEYT